MKHIGLFGGSFNPVHTGHLMLAGIIQQAAGLDEVWLVISPLNPLKSNPEELVPDFLRLSMVQLATLAVEGLEPNDVELSMPRPSYTVDTVRKLREDYRDVAFSLIIGADSFISFRKWKEWETIIELCEKIFVYPRTGFELPDKLPEGFEFVDAPVVGISSSDIRKRIKAGDRVNFMIPDNVYSFIKKHKLYQ